MSESHTLARLFELFTLDATSIPTLDPDSLLKPSTAAHTGALAQSVFSDTKKPQALQGHLGPTSCPRFYRFPGPWSSVRLVARFIRGELKETFRKTTKNY